LALKSDGTVEVWGDPGRAWAYANVPSGLTNLVAISANGDQDGEQSLVLKADGTVVAWGNVASVPIDLSNVVAIAAGGWHELALKRDGSLVAWGDDNYGQTDIPEGWSNNIVAIAAGDWHSVVLRSDGTVAAWGVDWKGEVAGINGLTNVVAIAAGPYRSLALKSDGTIFACGNISAPPASLTNVIAISTGAGHSVAISAPLQIATITLRNQHPLLGFRTFSGQEYSVEYSSDLSSGSWLALPGGDVVGNGMDALLTDPQAMTFSSHRFYRLRQIR
jgi:hypothetical protein